MPVGMNFEEYREEYVARRAQINVCGGILVSEDKKSVLLIQENFSKWGLPKGKIESTETDEQCAEREIFEETGYKTGDLTGCTRVVVKFPEKSKKGTFFVVEGVRRSTFFSPAVKGEIKAIQWFDVNSVNGPAFTKATRDAISSYKSLMSSKRSRQQRQQQQQQQQTSLSQKKGGQKKKDKDKEKSKDKDKGVDKPKPLKFNLVPPKVSLNVDVVVEEILDMYFLN